MPLKEKSKKKVVRKRICKKKTIKKQPVKKKAAKKQVKKTRAPKLVKEKVIGVVTHYFPQVRAAVIKLKAPLSIGDAVKIKGHSTDFTQTITSMQIDRVPINSAKKGQEIGLLVDSRVRQNDTVYAVK